MSERNKGNANGTLHMNDRMWKKKCKTEQNENIFKSHEVRK